MSFTMIDPILFAWAEKHKLNVITKDRDWEVRSINIPGRNQRGPGWHIWISHVTADGHATVHLQNLSPPKDIQTFAASKETLAEVLDQALALATGRR